MHVTKERYYELTGLTVRAQEGRIRRGQWRQGIEWALIDGAQMPNVEAIERRNQSIAESQRPREPVAKLRVAGAAGAKLK